ncbi:F-box/WD repeat-containing protein 5 [Solenopsis invicta]|uniref:F-box/WD repeat-containing protein 5 n=1 Tax=Solenopsis invicta TaxID=13686 RepID=UPI00059596D1|nr:F-box/WD repeat-containing protein 5 [Solenopsis invicta]
MDDVEDTARADQRSSDEEVVSETSDDGSEYYEGELNWYVMSDSILLSIFQYLTPKELMTAGEVCRSWYRVSRDEFLWKYLFYRTYKIDPDVGIVPGKTSWLGEFKRLAYHTPLIETEVLKEHSHQVLHVSFSHNGKMFATCSKDGYILVWQSQYPVTIKYLHDMKTFSWKYTQFSQFNCTDTLLLVSGVHFGTPHSTSGEIAVFRVAPGFDLQCRVVNKPYDIFGTWYSERYLLSGNLHWLAHLVSTSVVWLNKANQESASEHVPIMSQLFRFYNGNASSIRAIMVANCLAPAPAESTEQQSQPSSSNTKEEKGNPPSHKDLLSPSGESNSSQNQEEPVYYITSSRIQYSKLEGAFSNWRKLGDGFEYASPIQYNQEYRQVEMQKKPHDSDSESENPQWEEESESGESSITEECDTDELANNPEKLLIFTTGSKTYTPHKVGFKRIKLVTFPRRLDPGPSLRERIAQQKRERERQNTPSVEDWLNYESVADKFDKIDHLIDLHGHIIGMGLSPDHRYLYVNTRPWPKGYVITNPLQPPPIAQEIDIHVIDLVTLKQVGTMLRAHKAYTPNNECFFIFLDVCNEYVASGAEDKHGYLWDRHYGICLAKFPHSDVVNSVAFNPRDPEMLVTTSDDYTVKIWRSRAMVKALGLDEKSYRRGMEVRKRHRYQKSGTNID